MSDDNILFFCNPKKVVEKIRKALKSDENQANNLSTILSICIENNDYRRLYEYLYSEIEFNGGISEFSTKIQVQQSTLRKFLHSNTQPDLQILSKFLKELNLSLNITSRY